MNQEKQEGFKKLLVAGAVMQIYDVQGNGGASLTVQTDGPGTNKKASDLACIVPAGYIRYRFDSTTSHNGGGDNATVHWSNDDVHDGAVHLAVNCSGFNGKAHAEVSAVYAISTAAALRLHEEALKHSNAER